MNMGGTHHTLYGEIATQHPPSNLVKETTMIPCLMLISEDGDVAVAIAPNPLEKDIIVLSVYCYDLQLPPIPVALKDLQMAVEVWFGDQKATIKTISKR